MAGAVSLCVVIIFAFTSQINAQCSVITATPKFRSAIFDFSTNLIKRIAPKSEYHFVASPLSLWTVLSVAAEGAKGETYKELIRALRLPDNQCFRNKYYNIVLYLAERSGDVTIERNGLIALDQSLHLRDDFYNAVENILIADIESLNFGDHFETAKYINDYVKRKTHGKINEVVKTNDLQDVAMIIVDTVYFKASWNQSFHPENTAPNVFFDDLQNEIGQINLMHTSGWFNVAFMDNIQAQVLELPYGSEDRFSMLVVLPNDGTQLKEVIEDFDQTSIAAIYHEFRKNGEMIYDVYIPRFKIESNHDSLKESLMDLGIRQVFEFRANLTGMLDEPHYIDKITQKATMEVTEEGTVASAASTSFVMPRTTPDLFQANKPFLYLIVEKYTHTVLFGGAYSKPTLE